MKVKLHLPPHLNSVTTLPSKTTLLLISMLHFQMLTFQMLLKSVQYLRKDQLYSSYYATTVKSSWKGPAVWYPSKMPSSQMDTNSADRRACAHCP